MTNLRLLRLIGMAALFSLAGQTFAQGLQTLGGSRHAGPGAVNASTSTFGLGVSLDNGATFVNTASVSQTVLIRGEVRPEAADVGLTATIFVVDRLLDNNSFLMRTQSGAWVPWNGSVATLQAFRENETLTSVVALDLFTGTLGTAGNHRIFLGYMPNGGQAGGVLRYHVNGLPLTITAQQQPSVLDQAKALNASRIQPNVVMAACIACHVPGGLGGHLHTFVEGSSQSVLDANFDTWLGLKSLGKAYILGKVGGTALHDGGAIFPPSTQQYQDLSQFLTLLEQL